MNEMYPCINRNARPNNNQLITYYECVSYLLRIHSIDNTYNTELNFNEIYKIIKTRSYSKYESLDVWIWNGLLLE